MENNESKNEFKKIKIEKVKMKLENEKNENENSLFINRNVANYNEIENGQSI